MVTAQTPSLYAPNTSADPKFTRPLVDTTRTMTVIPDQVIKDQGVNNLTDALKNVPGWGRSTPGKMAVLRPVMPCICVAWILQTAFTWTAFVILVA